jgi:hypothetical protein
MPGVQFGNQIDMNGHKVTEVGAATNPTDAVILSQLTAATGGFVSDLGDGLNSTLTVVHNLNLNDQNDFVARVAVVATGQEVNVDITGTDVNTVSVTFGSVPALDSHRIAILPVRP